jgi:hypothetical protein
MIAKLAYASALAGFALVASSAGSADAANFAGTWTVAGTLGNPIVATSAPVCVFRQSGNAISGSCKGPNGIGSADGSVNGRAMAYHRDECSRARRNRDLPRSVGFRRRRQRNVDALAPSGRIRPFHRPKTVSTATA